MHPSVINLSGFAKSRVGRFQGVIKSSKSDPKLVKAYRGTSVKFIYFEKVSVKTNTNCESTNKCVASF